MLGFSTAFRDLSDHLLSSGSLEFHLAFPSTPQVSSFSASAAGSSYSAFLSLSCPIYWPEHMKFQHYARPTSSIFHSEPLKVAPEPVEVHVPRPLNCWKLYLSAQRRRKSAKGPVADFVKRTVATWRGMAGAEKDLWRRRAEDVHLEHKRLYPDYKYQPKSPRKGKKGAKSA
jgi:hypothetical protein